MLLTLSILAGLLTLFIGLGYGFWRLSQLVSLLVQWVNTQVANSHPYSVFQMDNRNRGEIIEAACKSLAAEDGGIEDWEKYKPDVERYVRAKDAVHQATKRQIIRVLKTSIYLAQRRK
jgi:hypothetical protein